MYEHKRMNQVITCVDNVDDIDDISLYLSDRCRY